MDEAQLFRYEISYFDIPAQTRIVFGRTDTEQSARELRDLIHRNPNWADPKIHDNLEKTYV